MSSQEFNALHIIHVASALMLMGYTFFAFAAPPERRKQVLAMSGIAALLMALTGLRMWQAQFNFVFAGWVIVKIVCWLGLAAIGGMGFRRREHAGRLIALSLLLGLVAVSMAYLKPF
jgi:hypothetical protein